MGPSNIFANYFHSDWSTDWTPQLVQKWFAQVLANPFMVINFLVFFSTFLDFYYIKTLLQVLANPFLVMNLLAENFGYLVPNSPLLSHNHHQLISHKYCLHPNWKISSLNKCWCAGGQLSNRWSSFEPSRRAPHMYLHSPEPLGEIKPK